MWNHSNELMAKPCQGLHRNQVGCNHPWEETKPLGHGLLQILSTVPQWAALTTGIALSSTVPSGWSQSKRFDNPHRCGWWSLGLIGLSNYKTWGIFLSGWVNVWRVPLDFYVSPSTCKQTPEQRQNNSGAEIEKLATMNLDHTSYESW